MADRQQRMSTQSVSWEVEETDDPISGRITQVDESTMCDACAYVFDSLAAHELRGGLAFQLNSIKKEQPSARFRLQEERCAPPGRAGPLGLQGLGEIGGMPCALHITPAERKPKPSKPLAVQ